MLGVEIDDDVILSIVTFAILAAAILVIVGGRKP
jgi:hypothetical protein